MGDSSEESWTMHESVILLYRVSDEGYIACKTLFSKNMLACIWIVTCLLKKPRLISVPAAAVIQKGQVLFGIIGRKWRVGCVS